MQKGSILGLNMKDIDNVYRTREFIVLQTLSVITSNTGCSVLLSTDAYILRDGKRDYEYESIFANRGKDINGKRIKTATHIRHYIA